MAGSNINVVVVTGNLTADPELRETPGGTPVCKLRIAVNTSRKTPEGNWEEKPNYFDVTVWGAQGANCANYLSRAVRLRSTAGSTGTSGPTKRETSARPSRSSPTPSSSSAAATAPAAAVTATVAAAVLHRRRLGPSGRHVGLRLAGARVGGLVLG